MGTRADFYIGRGKDAEWLGSTAWDGYPEGAMEEEAWFRASSKMAYKAAVLNMLDSRDDATKPEDGWPWPWEDSGMTDYAYAFDDGQVWFTLCEDYPHEKWCSVSHYLEHKARGTEDELKPDGDECEHPDMSAVQNVTLGKRSGVLILGS